MAIFIMARTVLSTKQLNPILSIFFKGKISQLHILSKTVQAIGQFHEEEKEGKTNFRIHTHAAVFIDENFF